MLGGLLAACQLASATSVNITRKDPAPGPLLPGVEPVWGFGGGPFSTNGTDGEDNETEASSAVGTLRTQAWDLEGFSLRGTVSGPTLSLVGGFDFVVGEGGYLPGHLFIKVGGINPGISPIVESGPTSLNVNGYDYAVDLVSGKVWDLSPTSVLKNVDFDVLGSNPFQYDSGGSLLTTLTLGTTLKRDMNKSAADTALITEESSFGALAGYNGDNTHNIVQVNLGFLGAVSPTDSVYFTYTMGCGNDVVKGQIDDGFKRIPDGGGSLMLLGMGLCSLFAVGRRSATR